MRSSFLLSVVMIWALAACTESVEQAVEGLSDADPQRRQAAARSLSGRVDGGSAELLMALLFDADPAVRSAAFEALATVGDPSVQARLTMSLMERPGGMPESVEAEALPLRWGEPALEALLRPPPPYAPPEQESRLIRMLAPFADARAVRALAARLGRPEPVRAAALQSLQANPAARQSLAEWWADASAGDAERLIAVAARVHLGERDQLAGLLDLALSSTEPDRVGNLLFGIGEIPADGRAAILSALQSPDSQRRFNAASLAGALGVAEAAPGLLELLEDENRDPPLRAAAATSLGQLQYAGAAPALVEVLITQFERELEPWGDEGCEEVEPDAWECFPTEQSEALEALKQATLGALPRLGPAIVEPLLTALGDRSLAHSNFDGDLEPGYEIQQVFATAGEETVEAVMRVAESDPEPEMLEAAASVIKYSGGRRGAEVMIGLLGSDDDGTVDQAAGALATLADPDAVGPLVAALPRLQDDYLEVLDEWDRPRYPNAAARALVAIGPPSVAAVRQALAGDDPLTLAPAAWVSAKLGDREAAGQLLKLFDHRDENVRDSATLALGELRYGPAVDPMLQRAKEVRGTDEQYAALPVLLKALGVLRDPRALPLLQELARDEYHFWEAMPALAEIPDPAVEKQLMAALEAEDLETVAAAYRFYIRKGVAGSEERLIAALDEYGDGDLALDYLNSGNTQLAAAGREWLEANDYLIFESIGEADLQWGSH